ncbi:MAG: M20 family metallopeptidase [Candidatus Dormibacteraeota bacterium]|nr:M20 family metallopeptidase [Candidatus Dormibacteraeota bacterium]
MTGEEGAVAEVVAGWCEAAGLEVELRKVQPGRPNVVARWDTGRRPIQLLTGHLDTVPVGADWTRDPYGAEVEGGRLYGRGACDMKGGLAAMLGAVFDLRWHGLEPAGGLLLAAVVGEEEDSAGTIALLEDGLDADRAILGEPTNLELVRSNRGLINYSLAVTGASAHASSPELGRNAIVAAAHIVLELEALAGRLARDPHPTLGPPNLTVGTIHGGTRPYVVPDRCVVEVDRRVNPGESAETVRVELEDLVSEVRARLPWLVVEPDFGWEYLPFELEEGHPLVRALSSALSEVGIEPRIGAWRAASDAGFLAVRAGIPTLLFGPGHIEAAHRPDEFVELAQVETARDVYSRLLLSH